MIRPYYVKSPTLRGEPISVLDLDAAKALGRWTARGKAMAVELWAGGVLPLEVLYGPAFGVAPAEFQSWCYHYMQGGVNALRIDAIEPNTQRVVVKYGIERPIRNSGTQEAGHAG